MEAKVKAAVERYGLLRRGERVVVAVSGGVDSVALLHLLWRWRDDLDLALHVAHLNHRLRPEAEAEAAFVRGLAQDLKLPFSLGCENVPALVKGGDSVEDVARRTRLDFLARVAEEAGATRIALGHQANDQAETVLLHLLRGSGTTGLAGMSWQQGKFIRPLLGVTRAETETYCRRNNLQYVQDPSNDDPAFQRNRIRRRLLPLLAEQYNPNIIDALGQTAAILAEEDRYLDTMLDLAWPELLVAGRRDEVVLRVAGLVDLPLSLRRRAVRRAFFALVGRENNYLAYRHVEDVLGVLLTHPGKRLHLPRQVVARREGENLVFSLALVTAGEEQSAESPVETVYLPAPGEARIGPWRIGAEIAGVPAAGNVTSGRLTVECDFRSLPVPLGLRFWRPGDVFWPAGLGGRKKLQDFFVDAKVPREQRRRIPLVVCPEGIVWIVGYRQDRRWLVKPGSTEILRLHAFRDADA